MPPEYLSLAEHRLAYQRLDGAYDKTGIIFLCGFASDMCGTKASFLAERCAATETPYIRFDYRGVGQSDGVFTDGTLGAWLEDSLAILDQRTTGRQIIIGSSMGGWLGLLLAMQRPERTKAYIGIAAAPDFTEELVTNQLTAAQKESLHRDGFITSGHAPITQKLITEARQHLILNKPIALTCPARLLQGMRDEEVPWEFALRTAEAITGDNTHITLIKDGDHRLSRPEDLEQLWQTVVPFLST